MSDLEKFIAGLESMANHIYFGETIPVSEFVILSETVEFLKSKRSMEARIVDNEPVCGGCGVPIPIGAFYCPNCGRAVKWK